MLPAQKPFVYSNSAQVAAAVESQVKTAQRCASHLPVVTQL